MNLDLILVILLVISNAVSIYGFVTKTDERRLRKLEKRVKELNREFNQNQ